MANCASCDKISDYMIDSIMCSGNCRRIFHVQCIDAPFSSIKLFNKNKSFYYFCDKCDPLADNNIARDVLQNMKKLDNLEKQYLFLSDKVENITSIMQNRNTLIKSKNKIPYSLGSTETPSKRRNDEIDDENPDVSPVSKKVAISRPITNFNSNENENTIITLVSSSPSPSPLTSSIVTVSAPICSTMSTTSCVNTTVQSSTSTNSITDSSKQLPPVSPKCSINDTNLINDSISPILSGLRAVEGEKVLFISKLAPSTNALDIKNYLSQKLGTTFIINVEKILHRNFTKYSSFKIRVPDSVFHILNSTSFWPVGVIIHEFVNRPNNRGSSQNPFRQNRTTLNQRQSSLIRY